MSDCAAGCPAVSGCVSVVMGTDATADCRALGHALIRAWRMRPVRLHRNLTCWQRADGVWFGDPFAMLACVTYPADFPCTAGIGAVWQALTPQYPALWARTVPQGSAQPVAVARLLLRHIGAGGTIHTTTHFFRDCVENGVWYPVPVRREQDNVCAEVYAGGLHDT